MAPQSPGTENRSLLIEKGGLRNLNVWFDRCSHIPENGASVSHHLIQGEPTPQPEPHTPTRPGVPSSPLQPNKSVFFSIMELVFLINIMQRFTLSEQSNCWCLFPSPAPLQWCHTERCSTVVFTTLPLDGNENQINSN